MNEQTTDTINEIRELFLGSVSTLPEIKSFSTLLQSSRSVRAHFDQAVGVARSDRVRQPCEGRITCAIIGSSGHGKTTIMDEMFPGLSERGWLVTDVTDTTGQSLRISHAEEGSKELREVTVHSWDATQIKGLMKHPEVETQNERDQIQVSYLENGVLVDGSNASFDAADLKEFRFPRRMELVPFTRPFPVPEEKLEDPRFIRGLTVKEPSAVLKTEPLLTMDGRSYDILQLRAVVKAVSLRDSFRQIHRWSGRAENEVARLTFVDTPGLATPGNTKDEVLRHYLERKSSQVVLQLWKDDELDVVIHLVLCGRSSDFAGLWKEIEKECGPAEMADLAERLILAVNGMNIYFTNRDIKAKYEDAAAVERDGDQFVATLEDNILQKMSPRGTIRPARTVFIDSRSIVETVTTTSYADAYGKFRPIMESWVRQGGIGRETLDRLDLLDSFKANIAALADPEDRGQGHLTRELLDLVDHKGPALLLKKHLVKSRLLEGLSGLQELLGSNYDESGNLNREAVREALRSCLAFLDPEDLESIELFSARQLDESIDALLPAGGSVKFGPDWVQESFFAMCARLKSALTEQCERNQVPGDVAGEFFRHFDTQVTDWVERWGYQTAKLVSPEKGFASSRDLIAHCLKLHCREILYQLLMEEGDDENGHGFQQTPEDQKQIQELMASLDRAKDLAHRACAEQGVAS